MKNVMLILGMIVAVATTSFSKSLHTEKITLKVYGNCEMCKKRIESALLKNTAVKKAVWDVDTKIATVEFDPHTLGADDINKLIANAGYDTEKLKASDKAYKALPGCCQYERAK